MKEYSTAQMLQKAQAIFCPANVEVMTVTGTEEERGYLQDVQDYSCRFFSGLTPSAVAAALSCYDYQAFECPDYEGTVAARFVG